MTQEELAERAGLHAQEISKLERGILRTPRSTTVEFLADALKLDSEQKGRFIALARPVAAAGLPAVEAPLASLPVDVLPERGPLPAGSHMPLAANPLFVGRCQELIGVAAALAAGDTTVALGHTVASTGLGGLGKTQLAVELVHRYGRFFAGGVFWLSFASADDIPLQVAACADPGLETRPLEERVRRVKDAWQSPVPRLLVFDNCEEEALLEAWRPPSGGCRMLVTSRRSRWSPTLGVTALPLDLLPRADSIELLRRYWPDLAPDDPGLDALADELGDLPLALHLAGSYLHAFRAEVSLDGYLAELRRSDVVQHGSLLGAGLDSPSPTHHVQSVAQTFALCLGRLDREREVDWVAIALLARMACMAPGEPVPRDLLARTLDEVDPRLRADGLRRLEAVGLVEHGDGWLRLHRLVAHFVRQEGLDPAARPAVDGALIRCGEDAYQARLLTGSALAAVIPHLVNAANLDAGKERPGQLYDALGHALYRVGDLNAARPWRELAIEAKKRVLGPDHPGTAQSLNNLALQLWNEGELATARALHERALAIREKVLGPDHQDTAESLNNLALVLQYQGGLDAARQLFQRALAINEQVLGPDHAHTAANVNNLGLLLREQGHLPAARPLLERALAMAEKALGHDHPYTAIGLGNLGLVLRAQGEAALARALFERALAISERALGPDHQHTATSLNHLANLLVEERELAAARSTHERALSIRERVLGPDHRHTADSLHNLAIVLTELREGATAVPLFERALTVRERVLGPDHPDTVATRRALANLAGEDD